MQKQTLILGFGVSGQGVAHVLAQEGKPFFCLDAKADSYVVHPLYRSDSFFSESDSVPWQQCERVIFSPGFPPGHPWLKEAKKRKLPLLSDVEFALPYLLDEGKTLIAITGSNGKTTTTLLAAHLLGDKGKACGNVGVSLCDQIGQNESHLVIELSSFQLEVLSKRPFFHGAALLNLTPNHLDRHKTFKAYAMAKCRLSSMLQAGAPFWTQHSMSMTLAPFFAQGIDLKNIESFYETLESIFPLGYEDKVEWMAMHDHLNALFAYALVQPYGLPPVQFLERLQTFQKPPHRLEFVRELDGVCYINDSKATSVGAVKVALRAQKRPVVLISGGVDKGGSFKELKEFKAQIKRVIVYGEAAVRIQKELAKEVQVESCQTLEESVKQAFIFAQEGDTVLLSNGCSSFDQFKNYEERGRHFKECVQALGEGVE
jgi:UDP-N-acetylmuramoylalanine--D-glutamate ligase